MLLKPNYRLKYEKQNLQFFSESQEHSTSRQKVRSNEKKDNTTFINKQFKKKIFFFCLQKKIIINLPHWSSVMGANLNRIKKQFEIRKQQNARIQLVFVSLAEKNLKSKTKFVFTSI
jgi:hypothetical protein